MTSLEPVPDTGAAVEFLKLVHPAGPWVLTAIRTDRKAVETKTFRPETEAEMTGWLNDYNGHRNLYWSVNPPLRDIQKKATREDIKEVSYLHVDIDPRSGEDIEDERRRCLGILTSKLPATVPPPTIILFSGGGYQAFWKLETPISINGELALAENAKRYNQQLELLFGGDNCHNIDRIMRLPGTVNVPDERKRKKGRKPMLATLISFDPALVYPISDFTAAPVVQMPEAPGFTGGPGSIIINGNIGRLEDVNDLDAWGVPDRVKIIIAQGIHPDEPKEGDNSRSMWVFDAVCQLVRAKVPDEVIFSILNDPEFGISESILEKGNNAERYAIRQIERAKEEAIDPWLRKLNERYAVIQNTGGKCRVVEEVMDHTMKRSRLTRITFEDFRNCWMHQQVQAGTDLKGLPQMMEVGKWWLKHPQRRQFETIIFAPGDEVAQSYNLWRGYGVTAIPGKMHESFLEHLRSNVCKGIDEHYSYLLGWMARVVQKPNEPGEVAIVLRGGKGVGKSFFAKHFGKLFGRHYLEVSNPSHLVGNFNAHLRDTVLLFADEAFYANDKKHASILKTLITSDTLTVEAKGVDVESAPNFVHLIMASNSPHVVSASHDERRYFVLDVGTEKQQETRYFGGIADDLENGGYESLLHFLLGYEISDYEVRLVPQTQALIEQKLQTAESWMGQIVQMAEIGRTPDHDAWKPEQTVPLGEAPKRDAGWVSVHGILEAAKLDPNSRAHQIAVAKALSPLIEKNKDGEKISRNVNLRCIAEPGKSPFPLGNSQAVVGLPTRNIQRRMYKLRSLTEVRQELAKFEATWDTSVSEWTLNGDSKIDRSDSPF